MENNTSAAPKKSLTWLDVWVMAFGCMVGWGAFVMPGTTFLPVAGPAGTLIAMGIGVVIMLVIGYNFSYLMNRSPRTGGAFAAGMQEHISKPVDVNEMLGKLAAVLQPENKN